MEYVINTETWSVCFMFCIQTINAQNTFLKQEFWNWDEYAIDYRSKYARNATLYVIVFYLLFATYSV